MNNLVRCLKISSAVCCWVVIIITVLSNAYSFDNTDTNKLDLSLTRVLDYLSYNYKGFQIQITDVSIGETFDDNVTLAKENKKEDFITDAGFGLGVKYEGKNRTLALIGNITHRTFAENNNFDNTTEDVTLNFENEFTEHDRMSLNDVFSHSNEPLFFRRDFFEEQFGRIGGRFEYIRNSFHFDYTKDVAKQLSAIARYDNSIDTFSKVDLQDSFLNKVGVEADYLFSSVTTSLISYDFANRRFQDDKDASINTITAGIRQYITKKFYFEGRTGLDFIDSFEDKKLIKPVVLTSLTYEKDNITHASLSFDKKYDTSPYNEDIFNRWKTTASLRRQLSERLQCSLSLFYGEGEYISSNFKNTLSGTNSTLKYDITKFLKGNFTYTYTHSDTNLKTAGYTKNTVFLGLSAEF